MIGLLVFGHLALVLISLVAATLSLVGVLRKRRVPQNIATFLVALLIFVFLTWEHLVGYAIYRAECKLYSGFF
mgnify:CR=1 FL=1|tara:strand:- start:1644 stop:1862 length:219 start_codon:yes stop_codon:yes gene_type:complete